MRLIPVRAAAELDFERHGQLRGRGHACADCKRGLGHEIRAHFEHQLVVHLHDESRRHAFILTPLIYRDHSAFDDVRRAALHRRVDGTAFGVLLHGAVA